MYPLQRVAGTSAGAITALGVAMCPDNFDLFKKLADSLDYRKVPAEQDEKTEK